MRYLYQCTLQVIYIKNQQGLSSALELKPLISPKALKILIAHREEGNGSPDLQTLTDLLTALPEHEIVGFDGVNFPHGNNFDQPPSFPGSTIRYCAMVGVYMPALFKSNTEASRRGTPENLEPNSQSLGWDHVDRVAELTKKVKKELDLLDVSVSSKYISALQKALKKKHEWTIMEQTPESLLTSEACVIYMVKSDGFVNDKGSPVPLGGARLFESSAAAQRTIQSRGWTNVVIVRAKIQLEGIDYDPKNLPDNLGNLSEALSCRQARELRDNTPDPASAPSAKRPRL